MDSFELNKILGAILGTCLGVLTINIAAGAIFAPGRLAKPGYEIAVPEKPSGETKPTEQEQPQPIEEVLAKADLGRGEHSAKTCVGRPRVGESGATVGGPNLWGLGERANGAEAGLNLSASVAPHGSNGTIEALHQFLTKPKG